MITKEYYQSIGLTDEQTKAISKAMANEQRFRRILHDCGIAPNIADKIIAKTDANKLETMDDIMLTAMVKEDWADFIIHRKKAEELFQHRDAKQTLKIYQSALRERK